MMCRLRNTLLLTLLIVIITSTFSQADGTEISEIEYWEANMLDSHSLCISWTELNDGTFMYKVTICNNDTLMCKLLGTTIAHSFVIESLELNSSYSIHVATVDGNSISGTITLPEAEVGTDNANAQKTSSLLGDDGESNISAIKVIWISSTSLLVSWKDETNGPLRYSIFLGKTGTSQPVLQGTTTAKSFIIDGLESDAEYCIQVVSTADNTVSSTISTFKTTERCQLVDDESTD